MYLDTNVSALYAENSLAATMSAFGTMENQIATGNALANPATNPADSMITTLSQGHLGALTQASQNVAQGVDLLNTVNGAVQSDIQIVQQMQTLAVQASNGTNTSQDRADLQSQIQALASQIDANSQVSYNGQALLTGSSGASQTAKATWAALPWSSTAEESADNGQYGSVSNLVAPNLPTQTATGGPAQYVIAGSLNPESGPANITITAYASPAEVASADGAKPDGLVITLQQASSSVPSSGSIAFNTSKSSIPGFTITADEVSGGTVSPYAGPMVSVSFDYTFAYHIYTGTDGLNFADLGATAFSGQAASSGGSGLAATNPLNGLALQIGGRNLIPDQAPLNLPAVTAQSLGLASVSFASQADAVTSLNTIESALSHLTTIQSGIGSQLDQLQAQAGNLSTGLMLGQASQASIKDTNLATATAQAAKQQLLMQTGMQALVHADQQSQAVLSLLPS